MCLRVLLDEINIWIQGLSKAHCPPNVDEPHLTCWRSEQSKRLSKGELDLCLFLSWDISSSSPALRLRLGLELHQHSPVSLACQLWILGLVSLQNHLSQFWQSISFCMHLLLFLFLIYWSKVDLQCYVSFRYTAKWFSYTYIYIYFFRLFSPISHLVMSDSLWPHRLQHTRPPCPSPTPGVYSDSCPLSQWCHLTTSSSVVPFSSCFQSFQTSGSFQMSQLFASGGQNIAVSALTSVLPMNTQDWSPLG